MVQQHWMTFVRTSRCWLGLSLNSPTAMWSARQTILSRSSVSFCWPRTWNSCSSTRGYSTVNTHSNNKAKANSSLRSDIGISQVSGCRHVWCATDTVTDRWQKLHGSWTVTTTTAQHHFWTFKRLLKIFLFFWGCCAMWLFFFNLHWLHLLSYLLTY